jgi:hypothetical protein
MRRIMSLQARLSLVVGVVAPSVVFADPPSAADETFRLARTLAKRGDWQEACPLFAQSHRADPQLGTLLNLAECHAHLGLLATASREFREAAELARRKRDTEREQYAQKRVADLSLRVARLSIAPPAEEVPGLVVWCDGEVVTKLDEPILVDPGSYVITASAPGFAEWHTTVNVGLESPPLTEVTIARLRKHESLAEQNDHGQRLESGVAPQRNANQDARSAVIVQRPAAPSTAAANALHDRYIRVGAILDVGFRSFAYRGIATPDTIINREDENGHALAGAEVELWPHRFLKLGFLRSWSLNGRIEWSAASQPVHGNLRTHWTSSEITARRGFAIGDLASVAVDLGYMSERYVYRGDPLGLDRVPAVDYRALRLGVSAAWTLGRYEPYVSLDYRSVIMPEGIVPDQFHHGSVFGVGGALGALVRNGPVSVRFAASAVRYLWTFESMSTDSYQAQGAKDTILRLQLGIDYSH